MTHRNQAPILSRRAPRSLRNAGNTPLTGSAQSVPMRGADPSPLKPYFGAGATQTCTTRLGRSIPSQAILQGKCHTCTTRFAANTCVRRPAPTLSSRNSHLLQSNPGNMLRSLHQARRLPGYVTCSIHSSDHIAQIPNDLFESKVQAHDAAETAALDRTGAPIQI